MDNRYEQSVNFDVYRLRLKSGRIVEIRETSQADALMAAKILKNDVSKVDIYGALAVKNAEVCLGIQRITDETFPEDVDINSEEIESKLRDPVRIVNLASLNLFMSGIKKRDFEEISTYFSIINDGYIPEREDEKEYFLKNLGKLKV